MQARAATVWPCRTSPKSWLPVWPRKVAVAPPTVARYLSSPSSQGSAARPSARSLSSPRQFLDVPCLTSLLRSVRSNGTIARHWSVCPRVARLHWGGPAREWLRPVGAALRRNRSRTPRGNSARPIPAAWCVTSWRDRAGTVGDARVDAPGPDDGSAWLERSRFGQIQDVCVPAAFADERQVGLSALTTRRAFSIEP